MTLRLTVIFHVITASYILLTSFAYTFHVIREQNEGCEETRWYQL